MTLLFSVVLGVNVARSRPVPPVKPATLSRNECIAHHGSHGNLERHKSLETLLEQPERPACLFPCFPFL